MKEEQRAARDGVARRVGAGGFGSISNTQCPGSCTAPTSRSRPVCPDGLITSVDFFFVDGAVIEDLSAWCNGRSLGNADGRQDVAVYTDWHRETIFEFAVRRMGATLCRSEAVEGVAAVIEGGKLRSSVPLVPAERRTASRWPGPAGRWLV